METRDLRIPLVAALTARLSLMGAGYADGCDMTMGEGGSSDKG